FPWNKPERIATINSLFALLSIQPIGAPYHPRSSDSYSLINDKETSAGSPPRAGVGCKRLTISRTDVVLFNRAFTGVYKCCKFFNGKTTGFFSICTVAQYGVILFRIISTTYACSSKFFASCNKLFRIIKSSSIVFPRGNVPAKHVDNNSSPVIFTSLSGVAPTKQLSFCS